jgi:rRNA processing protein Gar1
VVPYVAAEAGALALQKTVKGYVPSALGPVNEPYSRISVG